LEIQFNRTATKPVVV